MFLNFSMAVISLFIMNSSFASSEFSIRYLLCNGQRQVKMWSYDYSGNTLNGKADTNGLISVLFAPVRLRNGKTNILRKTFRIPGLSWSDSFRSITFKQGNEVFGCAYKNSFGTLKYLYSCQFEAKFIEASESEKAQCKNEDATVFEGTFSVIR